MVPPKMSHTRLPNDNDRENPKIYRSVTCLLTSFELLTSILTESVYSHLKEHNMSYSRKKICRRTSCSCKHYLPINRLILENNHIKYKNLSVTWIVQQKVLSASNTRGSSKPLKSTKSHNNCEFLATDVILGGSSVALALNGVLISKKKKGKLNVSFFQRYSLYPLHFCLAIISL